MQDWQLTSLVIGAFASIPIAVAVTIVAIDGIIRPTFIPADEINRLAKELIEVSDNPEDAAMREEYAVWYRSDNFEQGKWRRIRRRVVKLARSHHL